MITLIIYICIVILLTLLLVFGRGYKKEYINKLNKKEHSLKFIYGSCMLCIDFVQRCLKKSIANISIEDKLSKINIKQNSKEYIYLYYVKKTSITLIVIYAILIFGLFKTVVTCTEETKEYTSLVRPGNGEGNKNITLVVESDNKREKVNIVVNEHKPTNEEILKELDSSYSLILKKFLQDNKSVDNIQLKVNPINSYKGINISWYFDNKIIDYNGTINFDNVKNERELIKVCCTLEKNNINKEYSFDCTVIVPKLELSIADKIIKEIDKNNSEFNKNVKLPELLDNKEVKYYSVRDKNSYIYLFAAFIIGILVFIIKDKDVDRELKKRKAQLEMDYAGIVNKLSLLNSAGMTLLMAWDRIIEDYNKNKDKIGYHFSYEEMILTKAKMMAGCGEGQAYREFGKRCGLKSYIKFSLILEQNLTKGTKGIKDIFNNEVIEAFEERKQLAKKRGDEAATKLLLPMIIMLIISIVVIIVPAFLSLKL